MESCEGIKDTFSAMFPMTTALDEFTLSSRKMSYLITEALGPYFKQKLLEDVEGT